MPEKRTSFDVTGNALPDSTPGGSINRARRQGELASRKARLGAKSAGDTITTLPASKSTCLATSLTHGKEPELPNNPPTNADSLPASLYDYVPIGELCFGP